MEAVPLAPGTALPEPLGAAAELPPAPGLPTGAAELAAFAVTELLAGLFAGLWEFLTVLFGETLGEAEPLFLFAEVFGDAVFLLGEVFSEAVLLLGEAFGEAESLFVFAGPCCCETTPPFELAGGGLAVDWRCFGEAVPVSFDVVPFAVGVGDFVSFSEDVVAATEELLLPPATVESFATTPHSARVWLLLQQVMSPDLSLAQY